jgi:predicted RNase H-like nuclease (RuvC/YqgF family)
MTLLRFAFISLLFVLLAAAAQAETCKYLDSEGRIIYSNTPNTPPKDTKKVKCFDSPAPRAATPPAKPATGQSSSDQERLPRVDEQTQKARDNDRRRILEQELAEEQAKLTDARKKLTEQEEQRVGGEKNYQRYLDRIQPFQASVSNHERNIEALKRELSDLK